jgi:predicted O-linked N-acetylglucosamine transferase (SPINDLY family)
MPAAPADAPLEDLITQARFRACEGAPAEAIALLEREIQSNSDNASAWHLLGEVLTDQGDYGEAAAALEKAAGLDATNVICRTQLGHLYRNMGMPEEAIYWHHAALQLRPDSLILRLNHAFVQPLVPRSIAELEALHMRTQSEFAQIEADEKQLKLYNDDIGICHPYYLIYENHNHRDLMERYGRLLTRAFGDSRDSAPESASPRTSGDRARIGFLSGFFYSHSHARAFEGLIQEIDRSLFEVVIIHLAHAPADSVSARLNDGCQEVVHLPPGIDASSAALRELQLDLLFFTDIGMHPWMTLLACRRLAPIQITGWGVAQTSGMPAIDFYISGDAVEPADADSHYSEALMRLPGLPCRYSRKWIEADALPREWFLLPSQEPLFGCLQLFEKIHPDFDAVLEQLAQRVPEAWFVFIESSTTRLTELFLDRLAVTAPTARDRIILLSRLKRNEYLALAGCMDVLLDPFHFCSGVSMYESLHAGTPIVTLEGQFLRSRFVAGAYRMIGVEPAPVAQSPQEYVALAAELICDSGARERLRQQIREKAAQHLYDRSDYVRGFERFATKAIERGT